MSETRFFRRKNLLLRFFRPFLPKSSSHISSHSRLFIAVGSIFVATIFEVLNIATFLYIPIRPAILYSNLALLVVSIASLVSIKKGVEPGKVVPFFVSSYILILAYVSSECKGFMAPGMYYYPIFLMYGALLSRSRWTVLQSVSAVVASIYVFIQTNDYGFAIPWGFSEAEYLLRMKSVAFVLCFVGYFCMALQHYFKRRIHIEIRRERQGLFRDSRVFEMSTISKSLHSNLTIPVAHLGRDIESIQRTECEDKETLLLQLDAISDSLKSLAKVSRSFHLVHDASPKSPATRESIARLFDHLNLTLKDKAEEQGWSLELVAPRLDREFHGMISSLSLLLISLAYRCFDRYSNGMKTVLTIEASSSHTPLGERVSWRLKWPLAHTRVHVQSLLPNVASAGEIGLDAELREEFIKEVLKECGGFIEFDADGEYLEFILRGDWYFVPDPMLGSLPRKESDSFFTGAAPTFSVPL